MVDGKRECLISPNKEICHIHKNMKPKVVQNEFLDALKIIDLENKNDKLEKKISKMIKFQDNQKVELTNLYKTIEKKNKLLKEKDEYISNQRLQLEAIKNTQAKAVIRPSDENDYNQEILNLKKKINNMKEDYNNFQIVKEYEKTKHKLLKKNIDIYNFNNSQFHKLRLDRNYIVHEKILTSP